MSNHKLAVKSDFSKKRT